MEQKTIQLAFDYEEASEAQPGHSEGTSAQSAQLGMRTLARIGDKRIIKLIRGYLNAGAMINGVVMELESE